MINSNRPIVDVLEPQAILSSVLVNEQGVWVLYRTVCTGPSAAAANNWGPTGLPVNDPRPHRYYLSAASGRTHH